MVDRLSSNLGLGKSLNWNSPKPTSGIPLASRTAAAVARAVMVILTSFVISRPNQADVNLGRNAAASSHYITQSDRFS